MLLARHAVLSLTLLLTTSWPLAALGCPPCRTDFGLECDSETQTCQGKLRVRSADVGHTWAVVRWRSPRRAEIPQASVRYTESMDGERTKWTEVHEVNESTARLTNLRPNRQYLVKVEEDGLLEVMTLNTLATSPRILLLDKGPSSVTLAWDDFRTDGLDYVLAYKPSSSNTSAKWKEMNVGAVPMFKLEGLSPNRSYFVRVELGDLKTEELAVTTEDGCVHGGATYLVGQTADQGCQLRCICLGGDRLDCRERCSGDTCRTDPCCALTHCGSGDSPVRTGVAPPPPVLPHASFNHSIMPRKLDSGKGAQLGCVYDNATYRPGEQFEDGCEARCVCDGRGRVSCLPRCPPGTPGPPGPTCRHVPDPEEPCCRLELCSPPGDPDTVHSPAGLRGPSIVAAESRGSTAASIRVRAHSANGLKVLVSTVTGALSWAPWAISRIAQVGPSLFQIDIKDLSPMASYYVKIHGPGSNSNTVSIKTFHAPVTGAAAGRCFHHNRSYAEGEKFEDGCQYRCMCRAGGLLECSERCPVFLDTVGYEHCQWGPAEDDPCCTVPHCNSSSGAVPPATCVLDSGEVKYVGDSWQQGQDCSQQVCTCVLKARGETEVRCKGRCPAIPVAARIPTPECPRPVLKTPPDPCLCPYMVCDNSANPLSAPVPRCHHKGRQYDIGKEFHDGCQSVCHCGQDLRVSCAPIECPHAFPPRLSECLEWVTEPDFHPTPPHCCPKVTCKNDGSCLHQGLRIANFQEVSRDLLPCGTRCVCVNGNLTCDDRCGTLSEKPPASLPCTEDLAYLGLPPGENCCRKWLCREPGHELSQVQVAPNDPTSVRVSVNLPPSLLNLAGTVEIAYSRDPSAPRVGWSRQTFSPVVSGGNGGEYLLKGLAPDTVYYLMVRVHLDHSGGPGGTGSGGARRRRPPESDVYKVRTSAASTTLPPLLELDMELRETDVGPREAGIRWRGLSAGERRLLDGIRVRYRQVSASDGGAGGEWTVGSLLHRDVTAYRLHGLQPERRYRVELVLVPREDVATELISSHALDIFTPPLPPDLYDFHVAVKAGAQPGSSGGLSLVGVPEPVSKFVHIARVTATAAGGHSESIYVPVKSASMLRLPPDLLPGKRYRVSVLLYLTNGKTLTSNEVDIFIPPGNRTSKSVPSSLAGKSAAPLQGRVQEQQGSSTSYFVALVSVAVLAGATTFAFLVALVLLVMQRRSPRDTKDKPSVCPPPPPPTNGIPRPASHTAYDNPTFKSNLDDVKPPPPPERNGSTVTTNGR